MKDLYRQKGVDQEVIIAESGLAVTGHFPLGGWHGSIRLIN